MDSNDQRSALEKELSRRGFLQATSLGATAAILAACTPGVVSSSAPATASAAASAAASGAASGGADLAGQEGVIWGLKYDPHIEAYQRLAALFESQTGAKMTVVPVDWPIPPKLIASIAAGEQPDVVCVLGSTIGGLYLQGALLPLTKDVFEAAGVDPTTAFLGDALPPYRFRGEIYGVPVEANNSGNVVNVPVDDVIAAGLADQYPPTNGQIYFDSYESLWELAAKLQVKEGDRVTKWGLSSKGSELTAFLGLIRSQGVKWWDKDTKTFAIDSEAGIKAFELFAETPTKLGIETELDQSSSDAVLAGKVAIAKGNPNPSLTGRELGYNLDLCGAPRVVPGEDPLFIGEGGWGFVAPRTAKNPALSLAFMKMLATTAGQLEFSKIYGGSLAIAWADLANDSSRFEDQSPDSAHQRAAPIMADIISRTEYFGEEFGDQSELGPAMEGLSSQIRTGKTTAKEAAKELQARAVAQYEQWVKVGAEYGS